MTAVGGSIESVSVDGREFSVATDADGGRKLGGFENDVQANGNRTARLIKTAVPNAINGLTLSVDDDNLDHEFLQERANGKLFFDFSITFVDGNTYAGQAQITGELAYSSQSATAAVNFMGPGELTIQ